MGEYHVRLRPRGWAWAFAVYLILTMLPALVLLIILMSESHSWVVNVVATSFLAGYVYSVYLFYKLCAQDIDVTLFEDRALFVFKRISFIKKMKAQEVHFSEIAKYTDKASGSYRNRYYRIILQLKSGTKFRIDPSLATFRKIEDYSKMNFRGDFMVAVVAYLEKNGIKDKIVTRESSKWNNFLEVADSLNRSWGQP